MGRLGFGDTPDLPEDQKGYDLPAQIQPTVGAQLGAQFSEAYSNSPGVWAISRAVLELPALQKAMPNAGSTMTIDQANQKYGLKLKPTFTNQITEGMADNLYRREQDKQLNEFVLQRSSLDPVTSFGTSLAAGAGDPLNWILGALPATRALVWGKNYAQEASAAGTLFPSAFRNARAVLNTNTALSKLNPFLVGALDNAGQTALLTPMQLSNAEALGQKYKLEDALSDIAVSGVVGGTLHAGMGAIFGHNYGRTYNTTKAGGFKPVTPEDYARAESDFSSGRPVDTLTPKDVQDNLSKLNNARKEVEATILDDQAHEQFVKETGMPEGKTRKSRPLNIQDEALQEHATDLEHRLSPFFDDPKKFREELTSHVTNIIYTLARLSELEALPKEERVLAEPDIRRLQTEVAQHLGDAHEILPNAERTSVRLDTVESGGFNAKTRKALGDEIARIREFLFKDISDEERTSFLQSEHEFNQKKLKLALSKFKEGESKGWLDKTMQKWQGEVAKYTALTTHSEKLLGSLGVETNTPELSLKTHLDAMGSSLPDALKRFTDNNPEALHEPMYRVRNQIVSNLGKRVNESLEYFQNLDLSTPLSKYPEDIQLLKDTKAYLQEKGNITPEDLHQAAIEALDKQIAEAKALGIFDEASAQRLDFVQEEFKARIEKTEAVKKGALQAQICALGGIE